MGKIGDLLPFKLGWPKSTVVGPREFFAGVAMNGFIARGADLRRSSEDLARVSVELADALIEALQR